MENGDDDGVGCGESGGGPSALELSSRSRLQALELNRLHDEEAERTAGGYRDVHDDGDDGGGEDGNLLDGSRTRTSDPSLRRDCRVLTTAWGRLSSPARALLLAGAALLAALGTYRLGETEGVREEDRLADIPPGGGNAGGVGPGAGRGRSKASKPGAFDLGQGGGAASSYTPPTVYVEPADDTNPLDIPRPPVYSSKAEEVRIGHLEHFNMGSILRVRAAAEKLVNELDEYYGGKDRATAMLVGSWQAQWMLGEDFEFLDEEGMRARGSDDDDDSVEDDDDADDDGRRRTQGQPGVGRRLDKAKRAEKKAKKAAAKLAELDANHTTAKNRKKKGAKEGKVLVDPDGMDEDELALHHQRRKQRTTKLVTTVARALLNPLQDKFVIGTIGSSVAAGHDNCHYDSYESQLERTLFPVFAAGSMSLIVQNAGEGGGCGDDHKNQVFCVTHDVSPDVDIIHYSWTYFEKGTPEVQREQLIRWAQMMPKRPMVHHLVARGKSNTCEGDNAANVELDGRYAPYGYNAFCIQTGLYAGGHDYDGELEEGINRFGWQFQGDGYHNTTRYGELLDDGDPRKESLGTVYRNWHPGPLGFQIASDAFSYVYATAVLKALELMEKDIMSPDKPDIWDRWFRRTDYPPGVGDDEEEGSARRRDDGLLRRRAQQFDLSRSHDWLEEHIPPASDLPPPLFCDPLYCTVPHPPSCTNYEEPTFGEAGIPVQSMGGWKEMVDENKWSNMVGKVDTKIIKAMHDPQWERRCKHLDACGGVYAQFNTAGQLVYELPASRMTAGLVFVCGCCGKNVGQSMFLDNDGVVFRLNGRVLDKADMDVYPTRKCVRLLKGFGGDYVREDTMHLTVEITDVDDPDVAYEDKPAGVKISHIVAL